MAYGHTGPVPIEPQEFTKLQPGFPYNFSDVELAETIASLGSSLSRDYEGRGYVLDAPAFKLQLLAAALLEQSRRHTETSLRASRSTARISLTIAGLALLLSLLGGLADYAGDKSWQEDQIRILAEIRDRLP
jgi:hypothetical protein